MNVSQQVIQQLAAEMSVPATYEATWIDPRYAPVIKCQSDVAVQQEYLKVAGTSTLGEVTFDPVLDTAWQLRSSYPLWAGDIAGAEAAMDEAERIQALYPESADAAALEALRAEIEAAQV